MQNYTGYRVNCMDTIVTSWLPELSNLLGAVAQDHSFSSLGKPCDACWVISHVIVNIWWLFSKLTFSNNPFRNTIKVSNGFDPDHEKMLVFIWIQTIWLSDSVPVLFCFLLGFFNSADDNKSMKNYPSYKDLRKLLNSGSEEIAFIEWICFVCFVALRPKSTDMVIVGRSVHLTTLFPGQAWTSG